MANPTQLLAELKTLGFTQLQIAPLIGVAHQSNVARIAASNKCSASVHLLLKVAVHYARAGKIKELQSIL